MHGGKDDGLRSKGGGERQRLGGRKRVERSMEKQRDLAMSEIEIEKWILEW